MARPRIFISSTYYDLKHLRSSVRSFVESLGYDSILSEKGDIAYDPQAPLDESCYREAGNADIFVLIVGGRYGSEKSKPEKKVLRGFFDRYDSITKQEYRSAVSKDIPIYILIESAVYSEYRTFLKNKINKKINYAHVDSVNVFYLIEDILSQRRNNPLQTFEHYDDIERWLREQWAGLFRELLNRSSSQKQLSSLQTQVAALSESNLTLKRYLEEVVTKVVPDKSKGLIKKESERLEEAIRVEALRSNRFVSYMISVGDMTLDEAVDIISNAKDAKDLAAKAAKVSKGETLKESIINLVELQGAPLNDFNSARTILNRPPFVPVV